jgi:hypothetical protein
MAREFVARAGEGSRGGEQGWGRGDGRVEVISAGGGAAAAERRRQSGSLGRSTAGGRRGNRAEEHVLEEEEERGGVRGTCLEISRISGTSQ